MITQWHNWFVHEYANFRQHEDPQVQNISKHPQIDDYRIMHNVH